MKAKSVQFLLILLILTQHQLFSQKKTYVDLDGKEISQTYFTKKYQNYKLQIYCWGYVTKDSGQVYKLKPYQFIISEVKYETILKEINAITHKNLSNNSILLIEFEYSNDLCSGDRFQINHWNKDKLIWRKEFIEKEEIVKTIKEYDSNINYIVLFDSKNIISKYINKIDNFFIDTQDFFKNNFFNTPAMCGSFLIIKPDGSALLRNGEFRPDKMLNYLEPKVWNEIFKDK